MPAPNDEAVVTRKVLSKHPGLFVLKVKPDKKLCPCGKKLYRAICYLKKDPWWKQKINQQTIVACPNPNCPL